MSTTPTVVNPTATIPASPAPSLKIPNRRKSNSPIPYQEQQGADYCDRLRKYIATRKGKFVKDEDGTISILLDRRIISLSLAPENVDTSSLMIDVCGVSTMLVAARIAIQRLLVHARKEASRIQSRSFAAVSRDGARIYVPTSEDSVLQISADRIQAVSNIDNIDSIWIRHPKEEAFRYCEADSGEGLELFERLLVETQACEHPEMRWFVAMDEGLFPFVRDIASSRIIVVHEGGTQQGKTTGAERFTRLHGLGSVTGNATVAALRNEPDPGLLVLDNKEQINLTPELIEHCLFLATNAEPKRSRSDGSIRPSNKTRPVAVITSIEGVYKAELKIRCAKVQYCVSGDKIEREGIERQIADQRHVITSSLVHVLQRFLSIQAQHRTTPNPFGGNFEVHFTALADLLRALAEVARKPEGWAEGTIAAWCRILCRQSDGEDETSELEFPISRILKGDEFFKTKVQDKVITYRGRQGTLYTTTCAFLLAELQRLPALQNALPRNPSGLSRRLSAEKFIDFEVVKDAPEVERTAKQRLVGFFFPNDGMTANDGQPGRPSSQ